MAPAEQDALALRERLFHEWVRECIICALLFASLYILCHFVITHFKKHTDFAAEHDDEDAAVNRIALGLCTFTLAVALGAVLLLPFSIISNEVLLSFPHNYYIQWLNGSLVHGGPLEFNLPLLQSVPGLPHALRLLLHRVGGFCGIQEGHHGQGVRDVGGAAAADAAGAGHGLGGLRHRQQRRRQPPVALRPLGVLPALPLLLHLALRRPASAAVHPLRPLHHVHRHGEAAGETPAPGGPGRAAELHEAGGSRRVPQDFLRQSFLLAELERGAAAGAVLRHPEQEAEAGAAVPSVALAEEPGLPPGHAGPPGADGHLRAHRLLPRPGAAAGRCRHAAGHPGRVPGPSLLLHLRLLRSCPAGRPHFLPDALVRRGLLQLPPLHPPAPRAAGHPPHQDHRELRLLAGAQLGPARLLQDTGDHPFRPPGGFWPLRLAGELLHRVPLQHGLRRPHHALPGEEGVLGRAGRAPPRPRSAQAAAAGAALPAPRQTLLGLGGGDTGGPPPRGGGVVSPPHTPGWPPAAELAPMAPGASGMSEPPSQEDARSWRGGALPSPPPRFYLSLLRY